MSTTQRPAREDQARQAIRDWIASCHDSLPRISYYQLLDVSPETPDDEIREAYYRQVARYHPDLYGDGVDPTTRAQLVTLYSRLVEAFRVLSDPARRVRYDVIMTRGVLRWTQEQDREPQLDPEATLKRPETKRFFKLARKAEAEGDLRGAIMNLKLATSLEPDSAVLKAELDRLEPPKRPETSRPPPRR